MLLKLCVAVFDINIFLYRKHFSTANSPKIPNDDKFLTKISPGEQWIGEDGKLQSWDLRCSWIWCDNCNQQLIECWTLNIEQVYFYLKWMWFSSTENGTLNTQYSVFGVNLNWSTTTKNEILQTLKKNTRCIILWLWERTCCFFQSVTQKMNEEKKRKEKKY